MFRQEVEDIDADLITGIIDRKGSRFYDWCVKYRANDLTVLQQKWNESEG